MANMISVSVLKINGAPQNAPLTLSFPTHDIIIQEITDSDEDVEAKLTYYPNPNSRSQYDEFLISDTVAECETLANTDGASMITATVTGVGMKPFPLAKDFLFPADKLSVAAYDDTPTEAVITFKGINYYVEETQAALVTAANDAGGGGESLFPTTGTGTATGAVIGDLDGNSLVVQIDALSSLQMYPTNISGIISDGVGVSEFIIINEPGDNQVKFRFNADDGTAEPTLIEGDAMTSTITYTADTHNIVGAIETGGQATFTGTLADAITAGLQVVNGLIIAAP